MTKKILLLSTWLLAPLLASASTLTESISTIEQQISGQIGVSVLDTQNATHWDYQGNEHFPMMSTFKTLACATMLNDVDNGHLDKQMATPIKAENLIDWSPVTQKLVGNTISIEKACEAAMMTSDNTAINIVLEGIGGPQSVTSFLRSLGDTATRLDRIEPELNQALAGDVRDTTTPNAINSTLNSILFKDVLTDDSKAQLISWMENNTVSDSLLRSILPKDWSIADRSGAGGYGSRGITAAIWTKNRQPLLISIYLTQTDLSMSDRDKVIKQIGQLVFDKFSIE